jgi:Methyltransferase FkbM domain
MFPSTIQREAVELIQLEVGVVSSTPEPDPLLDHLCSTLVAGVKISVAGSLDRMHTDVVWVDSSAHADPGSPRRVFEAAERGALVVVDDAGLLGERTVRVPLSDARFPAVAPELKPLQELLARLLGAVDEPHLPLLFGRADTAAVDLPRADVLVERDGHAWCARVRVGRGEILWLGLLPELNGAGFRVESHTPLRSAACQLVIDETLAYAFRRTHGLSVRKLFGPYGAPMLAWQTHVEELGGLLSRAMEHFVARLANSRQVPTFALIRRSFRWGRRTPGLVYLPWATDLRDGVRGQPEGAAFFSGRWITLADGSELGFPAAEQWVDFHTLVADQPRVYPAPALGDALALGTPDGRIELFSVSLRDDRVLLTRHGLLALSDGTVLQVPGASPTFGAAAGGRLLVIADDLGDLHVYAERDAGWKETARHGLGARVSPRLVDWTGSGTLDLMIGTEDGAVDLFEDFEHVGPTKRMRLFETGNTRVAPWPLVSGNRRRVLFGDSRGRLSVWEDGAATTLPGRDCTMFATTDVYLQQDSVPVVIDVEGRSLLIVGASVVGRPHTLGDPEESVTSVLRDTVARLSKSGTPCNPHLFLFQGASLPEVSTELSRHRASFAALGLSWDGMGANEHGWWIPRNQTALAFLLQRTAGLCFNFGWQSPGIRGAPDSDVKYALSFPFFLRTGTTLVDFLLGAPALPDRYPRAIELMAAAGLPLTFFVHPEYRVEGPAALEADRWIGAIDELKQRHGCVFTTENQMAKAIAVTLATDVSVVREASGTLRLEADVAGVPSWAGEFRRTLSVAVDWPGHPPETLSSDGVNSVRAGRFITSVGERTTVRTGGGERPAWRVVTANGPIEVGPEGIEVLTPGFQELHLSGHGLHVDWPGAHVRDTGDGLVVTRFGERGQARVHTLPAVSGRAPWSPHGSQQDRWVIERVFRGRTTPGFFVETGAADGVSSSATFALERAFGWTGIVVEPNVLFFERLRRNRRCHVANVCVAERSGPVEFIQASWCGRIREHFLGGLPERDHLQDPYLKEDLDGSPAKIVKMPALSLEDLLLRHHAPRRIDFMSIDAEFSEWFILKSFPFQRFEVLALCVHSKFTHEGGLRDGQHTDDIRKLLCSLGYFYDREYSRSRETDFFVHPRVIEHPLPDPALG